MLQFKFTEEDEAAGALVLPYPPDMQDGRTNRGFVDLRGKPELAREIAEASGSPAMQDLLAILAAVDSQFMTVGCELGCSPSVPGQLREAGGLLHLAFADLNGRALDFRQQQQLAMGIRMHLQAASGSHKWALEFIPSVIATPAIGGPEQVWSPVIHFYAFADTIEEATASREALIGSLASYLANPVL